MARPPVISEERWQEARRAAEIGLSLREVAEDFGVSYDAVRQRALREDWLTVNRLENKLAEAKLGETKSDLSQNVADSGNSNAERPVLSSESIEARLAAYHTRNKLGLAKAAGKGIETALAKMESGEIEVTSLQDLQTLANVAKIAWGGDSAQQAVQVNILNDSTCAVEHGDFPVFEAE